MTLAVGVIGTGAIGNDHIRRMTEVVPGARVVAVSDIDPASARATADRLGTARVHASGQEVIDAPDVAAVVVCSWGPTHEEYVLAAIAAGKPCFCEKPLATSEAACDRIIDAETAFGRRLVQVGFMRRFDRAYLAMRATIAKGDIGAPLLFHSVHRNASVPPHIGQESLINDTMVHDIDIARWLLDDEIAEIRVFPARVNRNSGPLREPLLAVMRMQGGALVDVEVSVNVRYGYDIRGEVSAETGTVTLAEGNPTVIRRQGFIGAPIDDDWKARFLDAYDAEFRAWVPAAAAGTAAGPSAWDGYAAALVTDAGIRALDTGEAQPIRMRDRPALYAG